MTISRNRRKMLVLTTRTIPLLVTLVYSVPASSDFDKTVMYDVNSEEVSYSEFRFSGTTVESSEGSNNFKVEKLSQSELEMFSTSRSFYSSYERTGKNGEAVAQETYIPYSVIDPDTRVAVSNTTIYPNRAIAQIVFDTQGDTWNCTGFMVSKNLVLTAGHCVNSEGNWHTDVSVYPGRNKGIKPYDFCRAKKLISVKAWVDSNQSDSRLHDFGAILLDCEVGLKTGWLSLIELGEDRATNIYGYPCDLQPNGQQWFSEDKVRYEFDLKLFYKNDTYGCMSGAPVMNTDSQVVAIHTNGLHGQHPWSENNAGTRLTEARITLIKSWTEIK